MGETSSVEPCDGGYGVVGTRVSLDSLAYAIRAWHTAASLTQSFPVLTWEQGPVCEPAAAKRQVSER
jgi:uncharacterized protein (DUF433 family)